MKTFEIIYTLFGGLGIFFYGMKALSDGLQSVAGDVIKKVISSLTSNRLFAVLVGVFVTALIQSSSVTTVMVVGFVNASLMSLAQAIGVIFGANIGTTVTAWIISIKIGKYGLVFIALGIFPMLFAKSNKWKQIGRIAFALGMIFVGLETMSGAFRPLRSSQKVLDIMAYFSGSDYFSYFASILIGCVITMIIQSSSAVMGIIIALATTGIISFNTSVALVIGGNIGTTITAQLAAIGATVNAKRAANAHTIFNTLGVIIIYLILPFYVVFIDVLIPGNADFISSSGDKPYIAFHIAMAHTIFNVTATVIFIPFLNQLARLVTRITPERKKEVSHLVVLGNVDEMLPATAILQAYLEMKKFKNIVNRMYDAVNEYLHTTGSQTKLKDKIKKYEQITDNIQQEVTIFTCKLMEKELSPTQSRQCQALVRMADELESIADYLDRISNYRERFGKDIPMDGETGKEFAQFTELVWKFFEDTSKGIDTGFPHSQEVLEKKSDEIKEHANKIRDMHLQRVSEGKYNAHTALTYSDLVVALRKIRGHAVNIAQAYTQYSS